MAHLEDYQLAQTIYLALQDLRSRSTPATRLELDAIATQAALGPNSRQEDKRSHVEEARAEAWLGICRLAAATAENHYAVNHNELDKIVDLDPLWSVALERAHTWIEEAGAPND
jgi:hypothetical protein